MQENNERQNPFLLVPFFMLVLLTVFGIVSFIPFGKGIAAYITAVISVLLVFGGVVALAFYLRGGKWLGACLRSRAGGGFSLCFFAACLMMLQSVLICSFLIGELYDYRVYSLYGIPCDAVTDSFGAFLLIYLVLAVLPAFLEGFLFRGFFMYEYRHGGVLLSVLVPSLLCGMLGMSFAEFPIRFLNSVLLCAVVFLTGNIFYSVLSHLIYGLFALSLEKYLMFIAKETPALSFLVLAALGLFFVICFCGSADKILRQRAEKEERAPVRWRKGKIFTVLGDIFSAPMIWADVFGFALIGILHIFLDV